MSNSFHAVKPREPKYVAAQFTNQNVDKFIGMLRREYPDYEFSVTYGEKLVITDLHQGFILNEREIIVIHEDKFFETFTVETFKEKYEFLDNFAFFS